MPDASAAPARDAFHVYDTTLRDGAQQEGLILSVEDKLTVARYLDDLGVGFIEGGWPGANPRGHRVLPPRRRRARPRRTRPSPRSGPPAAPGSPSRTTRSSRRSLDARTPVVTLVAKSHGRHVELALRTTREENLAMVADTVGYLTAHGRRVFLDAEHFFDGYRSDPVLRPRRARGGGRGRGRPRRSVRHQRRHAARPMSRRVVGDVAADHRAAPGHPLPQRHRVRRRQHAGRRRRGRDARAGHPQRLRRTHRQRRPRHCRRRPAAQARPAAAADRVADRGHPHLPRGGRGRPTSRRTRASLTWASAPSPTRQACTPARSRSTRCSTSTPTPPTSATTCACSSPTWPDAPRSSSRAESWATTCPPTERCSPASPTG